MSQVICCRNSNGIVLAGDSKNAFFDANGELNYLEVERLVQIGEHTAILAGGAAEGTEICHALKRFVRDEGLDDVQDVYAAGLPFLASEYEKFMRRECETIPIDPVHHPTDIILLSRIGRIKEKNQPFFTPPISKSFLNSNSTFFPLFHCDNGLRYPTILE